MSESKGESSSDTGGQKEKRERKEPARSDQSLEEWFEILNRHDPLEQYVRRRKRFEKRDPPIRGLKVLREGGTYYSLHLADEPIDRLRYRQLRHRSRPGPVAENRSKVEKRCFELRDLPGQSHIPIEERADSSVESFQYDLLLVEWANRSPFRGERRLSQHDPVQDRSLDAVGTSEANRDPVEVSCNAPANES